MSVRPFVQDPEVTETLALQLGLSAEEWKSVLRLTEGRTPTYPELGIFRRCGVSTVRINHPAFI